ncbi:hypothetical protein HanHA89_Chr11g0406701 [Helianthus annuus]|nr:hypothetical protein HanHA89_Chr11g0406701 [Helianthus annuus]
MKTKDIGFFVVWAPVLKTSPHPNVPFILLHLFVTYWLMPKIKRCSYKNFTALNHRKPPITPISSNITEPHLVAVDATPPIEVVATTIRNDVLIANCVAPKGTMPVLAQISPHTQTRRLLLMLI